MTTKQKKILMLVSAISILIIAGIFVSNFYKSDDRRLLRNLLNVELPKSVEIEKCISCALTDIISVCRFRINPEDYQKITQGYPYQTETNIELPFNGRSSCGGVGSVFKPAIELTYVPPEFKHGGWIKLYLSEDKSQALIDYYQE